MTDPKRGIGLRVDQAILVSAELRHRADFLSLPPNTKPGTQTANIQLGILALDGGAAALTVKVRSDPDESDALYQYSVEMMLLVSPDTETPNMPAIEFAIESGVAALYPLVREAIANITMRGRFGPIWLGALNVQRGVEALKEQVVADPPNSFIPPDRWMAQQANG